MSPSRDPPGRNAPCPCGSGRKYKNCCLEKDTEATPPAPAWTPQDREKALARLVRFAQGPEFAGAMRLAHDLFWSDYLDDAPPALRQGLEEDGQLIAAFLHFALFDMALEDAGDDGQVTTIADRFVEAHGWTLTPPQRLYLDRLRESCLRLYEITEVRLDEGLVLLDLWTGEEVEVRERLATRQLARWDLVAFRVVKGASGQLEIEGPPYVYPRHARQGILAELKRDHRSLTRRFGPTDPDEFFKAIGMRFHHWWLEWGPLAPLPTITTPEGDLFAAVKTTFDVVDPARVTKGLAAHPELQQHDDTCVWIEATGRGEETRALGWITRVHGRLTLETTSEARAARGRRLLQEALGDAIRFRAEVTEDTRQALADPPSRGGRGASQTEVPLGAEVLEQFYRRHYREWLDTPLPALKNRTPRAAARLKSGRGPLIELLKEFENRTEHARREGLPAYDLSWLWGELGLERP